VDRILKSDSYIGSKQLYMVKVLTGVVEELRKTPYGGQMNKESSNYLRFSSFLTVGDGITAYNY
jgi:hypothetical protein